MNNISYVAISVVTAALILASHIAFATQATESDNVGPFFIDLNLKAEVIVKGLKSPTSMAFLAPNDILVSEKEGTLQRIVDGVKLPQPLINLNVVSKTDNQGFLGIAVLNASQTALDKRWKSVYLYYTADRKQNESDIIVNNSLHNFLYKYDYLNNSLLNPKLVLDLPAGSWHNGGKMLFDRNNQLYLIVGEAKAPNLAHERNKALRKGKAVASSSH